MDDLPERPPRGTDTVTRRMLVQPQDEVPETYIKDGKVFSANPTEPKIRAEFKVLKVKVQFDIRPLQAAIDPFAQKDDLEAVLKILQGAEMDIKTMDSTIFVTFKPGN